MTVTLIASNAGGAGNTVSKTITVTAPGSTIARIWKLSPHEGYVGTKVTISGTGFGTSGVVRFGTVQAKVLYWSSTKIVVKVPNGIRGEHADVTVAPLGGITSRGVEFSVKGDHDEEEDDD